MRSIILSLFALSTVTGCELSDQPPHREAFPTMHGSIPLEPGAPGMDGDNLGEALRDPSMDDGDDLNLAAAYEAKHQNCLADDREGLICRRHGLVPSGTIQVTTIGGLNTCKIVCKVTGFFANDPNAVRYIAECLSAPWVEHRDDCIVAADRGVLYD